MVIEKKTIHYVTKSNTAFYEQNNFIEIINYLKIVYTIFGLGQLLLTSCHLSFFPEISKANVE